MAFQPLLTLTDVAHLQNGENITLQMDTADGNRLSLILIRDDSRPPHWFAIEDICTHDRSPLDKAFFDLNTCEVECPRHGGRFDFCTGNATRMPSVSPIQTFAIEQKDNMLWIDI